jgi:hypothetical protein
MVFLEVMTAGTELDDAAVCQARSKVLCEGGRNERAGVPGEEQLGIARLRQVAVRIRKQCVYVRGLPCDGKFFRKPPDGRTRLGCIRCHCFRASRVWVRLEENRRPGALVLVNEAEIFHRSPPVECELVGRTTPS